MSAIAAQQTRYTPTKVLKRDGCEVDFDTRKIQLAIFKAGQASREFDSSEARLLCAQVIKVLTHTGYREQTPGIERIQDIVEQVLISANHLKTARAYIVYREQHKKLREDRRTLLDVAASVSEYLQRSDWRVSANANQGYSLGGLILNASGKMIANYWLNHVYPLRSAKLTDRVTSIFMTSTCWPVIAPAGPSARCSTKG